MTAAGDVGASTATTIPVVAVAAEKNRQASNTHFSLARIAFVNRVEKVTLLLCATSAATIKGAGSAARAATSPVTSACACVWTDAALAARSAVRFVTSDWACECADGGQVATGASSTPFVTRTNPVPAGAGPAGPCEP